MVSQAERSTLLAKLRELPHQLDDLVATLTPAQLTTPVAEDLWTVAQHIHHLADSHMQSFLRLKWILTEDQPTLKPYDQDRWVAMADEHALSVRPSLLILAGLHERWVALWESITDVEWEERVGVHPESGVVTLGAMLRSYAQHGDDHLSQIHAILAAQAAQRSPE